MLVFYYRRLKPLIYTHVKSKEEGREDHNMTVAEWTAASLTSLDQGLSYITDTQSLHEGNAFLSPHELRHSSKFNGM
jgi:hypothetical protein